MICVPTLLVDSVSTVLSKKRILEAITFELHKGEVLALVGHNGAGKSTLIKTIVGVLNKTSGNIVINGSDQDDDLLSYKQSFSYLPEEPLLLSELTVLQHFQLYGKSYHISESSLHNRIEQYVTGFELTDKLNEYPESLSKGMRQKVQTICAFLPDTPLIIIDEPFMGLDVYAIAYFEQLLKDKIVKGTSILITSHQLDRVKNIADRYVLLQEGKLVQSGSIDDFDTITRRTE